MNLRKFLKMEGKRFKFRPKVRRFDKWGSELQQVDCVFVFQNRSNQRPVFAGYDYVFPLSTEHIIEHLPDDSGGSDGILILKSQISLKDGVGVQIEPITRARLV